MKQIITFIAGEIPEALHKCISSQETFAKKLNVPYIQFGISDLKFNIDGYNYRTASERFRNEYLKDNPYTLWLDWDILIKDTDKIWPILNNPDQYYVGELVDCLLYNGNVDIFSKVYDWIKWDERKNKKEIALIYKAFKYKIWKDFSREQKLKHYISTEYYTHLRYSQNGGK